MTNDNKLGSEKKVDADLAEKIQKIFLKEALRGDEKEGGRFYLIETIEKGLSDNGIIIKTITSKEDAAFDFNLQDRINNALIRANLPPIETVEARTIAPRLFFRERLTCYEHNKIESNNILGDSSNSATYLKSVLLTAKDMRASDIHISPDPQDQSKQGIISFRIDGDFYPVDYISLDNLRELTSYLLTKGIGRKGESIQQSDRLTGEHRLFLEGNGEIQYRLSTMQMAETNEREEGKLKGGVSSYSIVIRLLQKKSIDTPLKGLGFNTRDTERIERLIGWDNGLVIVTGGTGAGKTTTLGCMVNQIKEMFGRTKKVITFEDPIEYNMTNALQFPVTSDNRETEILTCELALKYALRQDPDVICIGEARDETVTKWAVLTALSGHFLMTTLHAGGIEETLTRLAEFGVKGPSLNSVLKGIISQKLVRKICTECKTERYISADEMNHFFQKSATMDDKIYGEFITWAKDVTVYQGSGRDKNNHLCEKCDGTGYYGRLPIVEVYIHDKARSSQMIYDICSGKAEGTKELLKLFQQGVCEPFAVNALYHMFHGDTSPQEIMKFWPKDYFKDFGDVLKKESERTLSPVSE